MEVAVASWQPINFWPFDHLYSPQMVETIENAYSIQLKQKIAYLNLTTAQRN